MSKKARKGRVRQTRTEWQKAFDRHPGMLQSFSWSDRLPELLHISMALVDHSYETVKSDFHRIADYVRVRHHEMTPFHFNLSHTIKLIAIDKSIQEEIFKTSFKDSFKHLIAFYHKQFNLPIDFNVTPNPRTLLLGYKQILNGRSDIAILCKYMMLQYDQKHSHDAFNILCWNDRETILNHVSDVMAMFPPSVGLSENFDLNFCQDIWMYNHYYMPPILKRDPAPEDDKHYKEMKFDELTEAFKKLYSEFKGLNLSAVYPTFIAEVNMGFAARISNLTLEAIGFVKDHKGEIAELLFRTILENCIVGSWLLKKRDVELHKRFREYATGRERFFGEKLIEQASTAKMKKGAKKMVDDAIQEAGVNKIDVATERGEVFDLSIAQMAEEVWGKDNMQYFLYKRTSEVIHGQWRVMAKYHLSKSANPMHNGAYWYNENSNKSAGLIPAFTCLGMASKFLETISAEIDHPEAKRLKKEFAKLHAKTNRRWMKYFTKYIQPEEVK